MLRIYRDCVEMVADVGRVDGLDRDHRRQLQRAALSVALNVAEGAGVRAGNRRLRYETALGSAREVLANLECAEALGASELQERTRQRLDKIIGTLVRVLY